MEILKEAERVDREEDELYGEARGDELPEHLRTPEGRRAALKEAKRKLEAERQRNGSERPGAGERPLPVREPVVPPRDENQGALFAVKLNPAEIVAGQNGRQGWLRAARHQLTVIASRAVAGTALARRAVAGGRAAPGARPRGGASRQPGL